MCSFAWTVSRDASAFEARATAAFFIDSRPFNLLRTSFDPHSLPRRTNYIRLLSKMLFVLPGGGDFCDGQETVNFAAGKVTSVQLRSLFAMRESTFPAQGYSTMGIHHIRPVHTSIVSSSYKAVSFDRCPSTYRCSPNSHVFLTSEQLKDGSSKASLSLIETECPLASLSKRQFAGRREQPFVAATEYLSFALSLSSANVDISR